MMVGVEWLIVSVLLALAVGWGLALLVGGRTGRGQTRIRELENELEAARQELEDYRDDVVAQFSETARKFKTLDDSYAALHRQLAESSSLLCGAAPGPLLEAPAPREEPELAARDSAADEEAAEIHDVDASGGKADSEPSGAADEIVVTEPEAEPETPADTERDVRPEIQGETEAEPRKSAAGP